MIEFLLQLAGSDVTEERATRQQQSLLLANAIASAVLFAVTWALWFRSTTFPTVPLSQIAGGIPAWCDGVLLTCALTGMFGVVTTKWRRPAALVMLLASTLLVCISQHRLQPWLHQFALLNVLVLLLPSRAFASWARVLLISLYVFSAISKLDYVFLHSLGQQFIDTLAGFINYDVTGIPWNLRLKIACLFPVAELLIAGALLIPTSRRMAGWCAIGMHVGLIAILGPWGLGHQPAVLVWNVLFVAQVWILFIRKGAEPTPPTHESPETRVHQFSWIASALVLLPVLEIVGLYDHWPAWQLYAPRNSRVTLSVLETGRENLPDELQTYITAEQNSPWLRFEMDQWSIDTLGVPLYPQDRFQIGVALDLAKRHNLAGGVLVQWQGVADRWTGKRTTATYRNTDQLTEAARDFRLNAYPLTEH